MLDRDDLAKLGHSRCPDCDHRGFIIGPRGGPAMNVECANTACRARFNITRHPSQPFTVVMAERLPKASEGGAVWSGT